MNRTVARSSPSSTRLPALGGVPEKQKGILMIMSRYLAAIGLTLFCFAPPASGAIYFSLNYDSPAIDGNITPDDILVGGPVVLIPGTSLGLQDDFNQNGEYIGDNLNALSFGRDAVPSPARFSVDRLSRGLPGTAVEGQVKPGGQEDPLLEEAAGDVFESLPPTGDNRVYLDERDLGLTPGRFGDDLDALSLLPPGDRIYFSIDAFSPSNDAGGGTRAGDIFLNSISDVFASGVSDIGLDPFDDLDALSLSDLVNPGVLDPGIDEAWFSISSGSPSADIFLGGFAPGDVLYTDFTGSFRLWASAADLGLAGLDELDAFATASPVPEPATLCIWVLAGSLLLGFRRTRATHRDA